MKKRILAFIAVLILLSGLLPAAVSAGFSGSDRIVIVLDPGHGGNDPGASAGGVNEKVLTLRLATLIRQKLEANGSFAVYMTRSGDSYVSLADRGIYADSVNADLLISIHFDSADGASWKNGVTAYTSVLDTYALTSLGGSVASRVASSVGMNSNGVMRKADTENYYWNYDRQWDIKGVNTGTLSDYYGIPTWCAKFGIKSLIVEHGFMSNSADFAKMNKQENLEKMAAAEADAIISYYTAHGHSYGGVRRDFPSNCVFQGKQSEHCTVCGHRRNVSFLPADSNAHYWLDVTVTPATCGRDGSKTCTCRITQNLNEKGHPIANHTQSVTIPKPGDHDYAVTETVAATHLENGYKQYTCRLCGYSFKDTIKAEGHQYQFVSSSEPTCTEAGGNLYRCSVCKNEYRDGPPATGHSFEKKSQKDPTCTEDGSILYVCKSCGADKTDSIPAKGHKYEKVSEKKPTCTEKGLIEEKCSVCSAENKTDVAALGHKLKTTVTKEPTCTGAGEKTSECTVCKEKKTEKIEKLSHEYLMTAYESPDCENAGKTDFVCKNCGNVISGTLKASGHTWKSAKTVKPRLFTGGQSVTSCIKCGKTTKKTTKPEVLSSPVWAFAGFAALALLASLVTAGVVIPKRIRAGKILETEELPPEDTSPEESAEAEETEEAEKVGEEIV